MISNDKGGARKKYKVFVENAIGKELKNPIKGAYGGIILGGVQFIKETLKKIGRGKLVDEEIANRRKIKAVMMEDIVEAAKDYYGISENREFGKDTGEIRKVLIYMIKKHTGATNREIGEYFGGLSYSAVAKINDRFKRRLKEDKGLRREVEKLEKSV